MPVGDSITDDCMTNGAWRGLLQPLLETNGILFTNTGRLLSGPYLGFTKRKHEGYCGAVIAPPGVFAVYNYSTTDAYLQKIVRDALAITNNRPNVILILIGANDIGRGRDPWTVATNDMPNLLSVIFSNVPNANVILAKITTLENADLGYNVFATNVPIYNAALQAMVNQRRVLGRNVFLADMFSAVDYSTMFLTDHLHPNPLGLKASPVNGPRAFRRSRAAPTNSLRSSSKAGRIGNTRMPARNSERIGLRLITMTAPGTAARRGSAMEIPLPQPSLTPARIPRINLSQPISAARSSCLGMR